MSVGGLIKNSIVFTFCFFLCSLLSHAEESVEVDFPDGIPNRIIGDIGGAVYTTNLNIGSYGPQSFVLPYGFFDYERFAMRIDQIAIKTFKVGYGYFEFAGKIDVNTYQLKSSINGQTINKGYQIPLGIGTFQDTPIGAFFINAYHDFGKSKGALYELNYFAEIDTVNKIAVYPQIGIERQSSQMTNYYFGIDSVQSQQTGYASYSAPATTNMTTGFLIAVPIIDSWYVNIYGKRKWLGSGINNSPVMTKPFQDEMFMSVAYRFK
jgi:outer membrane protein